MGDTETTGARSEMSCCACQAAAAAEAILTARGLDAAHVVSFSCVLGMGTVLLALRERTGIVLCDEHTRDLALFLQTVGVDPAEVATVFKVGVNGSDN